MSFLFSCFACAVFAQAAAAPPPVATKDPYVSPFADYRRFDAESPPKPWRLANDEVRDAGGHVGILKGTSGPAAAAAGKPPPPVRATPAGEAKKPPAHSHGSHR